MAKAAVRNPVRDALPGYDELKRISIAIRAVL
jgi:hypothetical protein